MTNKITDIPQPPLSETEGTNAEGSTKDRGITRRDFLKTLVVGGVGVAVASSPLLPKSGEAGEKSNTQKLSKQELLDVLEYQNGQTEPDEHQNFIIQELIQSVSNKQEVINWVAEIFPAYKF